MQSANQSDALGWVAGKSCLVLGLLACCQPYCVLDFPLLVPFAGFCAVFFIGFFALFAFGGCLGSLIIGYNRFLALYLLAVGELIAAFVALVAPRSPSPTVQVAIIVPPRPGGRLTNGYLLGAPCVCSYLNKYLNFVFAFFFGGGGLL